MNTTVLAEIRDYLIFEEEVSDEYPFKKKANEINQAEWTMMMQQLSKIPEEELSCDDIYAVVVNTIGLCE